jgi:hypothetical protein
VRSGEAGADDRSERLSELAPEATLPGTADGPDPQTPIARLSQTSTTSIPTFS